MDNNSAPALPGNNEPWLAQGKNVVKLVIGLAILGGIGYGIFLALPFILKGLAMGLEAVGETAMLIIGGVFLLMLLKIVTNPKTWLRFDYLYEAILELTLGWIVDFDPFVIARHQIEDKEKDREALKTEGTKVKGKKIEMEENIQSKTKDASRAQAAIQVLRERLQRGKYSDDNERLKDNQQLQLELRNFQRAEEFVTTVTPYLQDLSKISAFADKAYLLSGYAIEDAKAELETQQSIYSAVNSGERALQNAVKAFRGNTQVNADAQFALNRIREKVGQKVANIHNCISITSDYMNAIELNNAVEAKQIMAKIDNFNVEQAFSSDTDSKTALESGAGHFLGDDKINKDNKYMELI